jgi:predicted DCC family thiol-disulfide oxidoreductase YuxK
VAHVETGTFLIARLYHDLSVNIFRAIDGFFFRRIPATAFGMMRAVWGGITLLYLLFEWKDVAYFYSEAGIMPHWLEAVYIRTDWRFTILDYVNTPLAVHCLYLILFILLFCTMIGLRTRVATVAGVLLLFSFHERNTFILGGGDTLLRNIGFILMIAPGIGAFSVDRARTGWKEWKKTRRTLPPVEMPIWPWRLLLWQMIVLYVTSTWTKLLGTMWMDGTAIQSTLHHPAFARWPFWLTDPLMPLLPVSDYLALLFQISWLLLLVPKAVTDLLPSSFRRFPLRRILLIGGIFFHGGIFLLMDAGVFSLAVFVAYLGLLREDDIDWLKKLFNRKAMNKGSPKDCIVVLYDGSCGLCQPTMYTLQLCDWLDSLKPVNFRIVDDRRAFAPDVTERTLDKAMHIRLPDGSYMTGFDAFRYMTKRLPPLWPLCPLLWIPGVAPVGRKVYARIAATRKKCDHESCHL